MINLKVRKEAKESNKIELKDKVAKKPPKYISNSLNVNGLNIPSKRTDKILKNRLLKWNISGKAMFK